MPAGLEIKNNSGVEIIGPNAPNFAVIESGVSSVSVPTFNSLTEFVARRRVPSTSDYYWYKFGRATPSANFGLQLFDASGQLQFCAATLVARVVDVFEAPAWGQPSVTKFYPSGRDYAAQIHVCTFTEVQTRPAGPFQEYRIDVWRAQAMADGNSVTAGWESTELQDWQPVPPGGAASFPAPSYIPYCIVLDVTGY